MVALFRQDNYSDPARSPDFSLIIPCYCEAPYLNKNIVYLSDLLRSHGLHYELIFVEDFSPDSTKTELLKLVPELEAKKISYKILLHERNLGRGRSVSDGILAAAGEVCGFIDIDLENDPAAIFPMYSMIARGDCDVVVGARFLIGGDPSRLRRILHLGYRILIHSIVPLPISDTETGLKLFRREKILGVVPLVKDNHWFWDTEIVLRAAAAGLRIAEYPVAFTRDRSKKSTVRVFRDSFKYLLAIAKYLFQK